MANKPLFSTANKPIHSTGNRPVYSDFVQWTWLYMKISYTLPSGTGLFSYISRGSCYNPSEVGGLVYDSPGPTFSRNAFGVFVSATPASGYDRASAGVMRLNWADANENGGWAWNGTKWTALAYAWRYGYQQSDGSYKFYNGEQIRIDAAVMNGDLSVSAASDIKEVNMPSYLLYYDYNLGTWVNGNAFSPSPVATVSWTPGTQTLAIT